MKTWNKRLHKVNCLIQSWKQQWGMWWWRETEKEKHGVRHKKLFLM